MTDWQDLEEKCDQAITELMFASPSDGAPTLGVLHGMLEQPDIPTSARTRAARLLQLGENVGEMPEDSLLELSTELVGFLRFVCHRGIDPNYIPPATVSDLTQARARKILRERGRR